MWQSGSRSATPDTEDLKNGAVRIRQAIPYR
jgi:hypothetical protein